MIPLRIRLGLVLASLAMTPGLGGCRRSAEDPAAVTTDEQDQLNDAAAMLDANAQAPATDDDPADSNAADTNTEDRT